MFDHSCFKHWNGSMHANIEATFSIIAWLYALMPQSVMSGLFQVLIDTKDIMNIEFHCGIPNPKNPKNENPGAKPPKTSVRNPKLKKNKLKWTIGKPYQLIILFLILVIPPRYFLCFGISGTGVLLVIFFPWRNFDISSNTHRDNISNRQPPEFTRWSDKHKF